MKCFEYCFDETIAYKVEKAYIYELPNGNNAVRFILRIYCGGFTMPNAIVWLHYTEIYREAVVPTAYSYIYFGTIITLLIIANVIAARRLNADSTEETEV